MYSCLSIEKNFFISCNTIGFHYVNTNLGFRGPTCFFCLICCFAYQFVSCYICLNNSVLKNISNVSKGQLSWVTGKFLFIHVTPEIAGFWMFWICSSHPDSKSVYAHLGMALPVVCLDLTGQFLSFPLLLLLMGEFSSHMSQSESWLKLPPSESVSFMVLLILSVWIHFFYEVFCALEPSPWFSTVLGAH
jgi:hypothetical protein